ncbi:MAG: tyrosine-type recombinase/integrase [Sandaracinaceae bacterium]|nr:tyrosine-type recombinase/integrase [Sandaracinaceae bacterium]
MKRANGSGSIEVLPSGKARLVFSVAGKRRRETFPSEQAARDALAALEAVRAAGVVERPDALTLAAWGDVWLTERELHGSRTRAEVRDVAHERSTWRTHVAASPLAPMALRSIRHADVEALVRWLRTRPAMHPTKGDLGRTISGGTQRHVIDLVRRCLADAVVAGHLAANPAAYARVVAHGPPARRFDEDWLRAEEIDRLLACEAISVRDRTVYAAAIGLALRLNDLKSLRLADVHLDAQVPGPHVALTIGKTGRQHRVPILPWLRPWLAAHVSTLPEGAVYLFPHRERRRVQVAHVQLRVGRLAGSQAGRPCHPLGPLDRWHRSIDPLP